MTTPTTPDPKPRPGPFAAILKNVTSNWAALLVNTIISFVLAPIVVRGLGSTFYGIWSLLTQFTGYLWLFDFGVRESVIKYVAQHHAAGERDQLESTIGTAVSVYALVSTGALVAVGLLAAALPHVFNIPADAVPAAQMAAFLTGASVAQSFLANVYVGVLMGLQRFYLVARIGMAFSLVRGGATYGLLAAGYGIVGLSLLNLLLSIAMSVLVYYLARRSLPGVSMSPARLVRQETTKLFNYGKYVILSNVGDKLVFATDAIVIGAFLPIETLTPYAIAGTLIGQMRSVVMSMASVFNPLTSSLQREQGTAAVGRVVQGGAKGATIVGLPICIGFLTLGEPFVALWMGNTHAPMAGLVLRLLAVGYIVGMPYYAISGVLYGLGQHRVVAWLRVVEGAMNLAMSVVLVRVMGLAGVAIGTAVPHILIVGAVLPACLPRFVPVRLRDYYVAVYLRPGLAAVPFSLACLYVANVVRPGSLLTFFGWGFGTLALYALPIWFVALTDAERRHIKDAVRAKTWLPRRLREGLA